MPACEAFTLMSNNSGLDSTEIENSINLLSFNIQAGTTTDRYHHYVTRSWKQLLPHNERSRNLDAIAELISEYDIVGLQEADTGSFRSGFINQTRYLSREAGFAWQTDQSNRKVGNVACAGNGVMARWKPDEVISHKLPGSIPGRGVLTLRYGNGNDALLVVVLHLALGRRARTSQLGFVSELLQGHRDVVVMGDLNTDINSPELGAFVHQNELQIPTADLLSFPSWQPLRAIDHIMLSSSLEVIDSDVLDVPFSDHCPVIVKLSVPTALQGLEAAQPQAQRHQNQ